MLERLYYEGVIPFKMTLSDEVLSYIKMPDSYTLGKYPQETNYGILNIKEDIISKINGCLPEEVWQLTEYFRVNWGCVVAEKGYHLTPHNDFKAKSLDGKKHTATARIVFWICLDEKPFKGRDFVWGRFKDTDAIPTVGDVFQDGSRTYDWNDPNLEEIGRIKPATGLGVVIDWTNPVWWHGVTKLQTKTKIISIVGTLC